MSIRIGGKIIAGTPEVKLPDLSGFAKTDLSNINPSMAKKGEIVRWGMPNYTKGVESTSGSTTALFDCFVTFSGANGKIADRPIYGYSGFAREGEKITYSGKILMYALSYRTDLPDYYSIAVGAPYTATEDGWLNVRINRPDAWGTSYAYIDGKNVFEYYGRATTSGWKKLRILKGQKYTTGGCFSNPKENTWFANYDF